MPVTGAVSITLQVPDVEVGAAFYRNAGLEVVTDEHVARCRCPGSATDAVVLVGGAPRKRLDHARCARRTCLRSPARSPAPAAPSWTAPRAVRTEVSGSPIHTACESTS